MVLDVQSKVLCQLNLSFYRPLQVEKECLSCGRYIFPGEEIECSIRGCGGVYHGICAKKSLGFSGHRTFKCPQHVILFYSVLKKHLLSFHN